MTCRELTSFIADYVSGELAGDTQAAVERHLSRCPNCQQYVADYQRTIELGRSAYRDEDPIPDDVPAELVEAILAARRLRDGGS